jgi:hypothetical protein
MMKYIHLTSEHKRLLRGLPHFSQILRGSLLQRTIRHRHGCPKCERGGGHPVWVLTVGYPGGEVRQLSLSAEQIPQVRQWLDNYQQVKKTLEALSELNQQFLRQQRDQAKQSRSKEKERPR